MSPSHVSPAGLVTRQRRRFRSCSIDITAYHLAGTEHPDALTAAKRKGTFRKKRSPISLSAATPRRVRFWAHLRPRGMSAFGGDSVAKVESCTSSNFWGNLKTRSDRRFG